MKINFYTHSELVKGVIPPPKQVKTPSWFKDIPNYDGADKLNVEGGLTNYTVKSCVPFLDTFSTGYVFELWCDVQIRNINGEPYITWAHNFSELEPIVGRPNAHLPVYDGFLPFNFAWSSQWGIETPKGYSCLFTHPLNRTDLPFITTSGIIDTDGWGVWGNQPFALKKNWEGIIEAGTPIIQFIPFKREKWESSIIEDLEKGKKRNFENIYRSSKFRGYYKNKYWNRKFYS